MEFYATVEDYSYKEIRAIFSNKKYADKFLKNTYILANAFPYPTKGIEIADINEAQILLKELTSNNGQYLEMVSSAIKNTFKVGVTLSYKNIKHIKMYQN